MKLPTTFSSLALLALSTCVYGQVTSAGRTPAPGVPGYLDTKTGAFRPLRQAAPDAAAVPNIANTTGKFVFTFTISIQSSFPSSLPIVCSAIALGIETNSTTGSFREVEETGEVTATRSGNTATCTVNIPYSWPLATPSSDTVELTVSATALSTSPAAGRTSYQDLGAIRVPVNGATTTQAVSITL